MQLLADCEDLNRRLNGLHFEPKGKRGSEGDVAGCSEMRMMRMMRAARGSGFLEAGGRGVQAASSGVVAGANGR